MKNPKRNQPDPVSGTIAHEGVNKPMNNPLGTDTKAAKDAVIETQTDTKKTSTTTPKPKVSENEEDNNPIDYESLEDGFQSDIKDDLQEGLTPPHYQNIDEARIDEVLVEDSLADKDYPTIKDIAAGDAVEHSHEDDL